MQHPLFDAPTKLPPKKPEPPLPPPDEVTVFDETSVDDNYEGRLAPHQIERLRKSVFNSTVLLAAAFGVTVFLGFTAWSGERLIASIIALVVLLAICGAMCVPLIRRIYNLRRDIKGQIVLHVDGRISLLREIKNTRRGSIRNHSITIGGTKFYVPESAFEVCRRDMPYRLYYTPVTRQFMNIHSLLLSDVVEPLS